MKLPCCSGSQLVICVGSISKLMLAIVALLLKSPSQRNPNHPLAFRDNTERRWGFTQQFKCYNLLHSDPLKLKCSVEPVCFYYHVLFWCHLTFCPQESASAPDSSSSLLQCWDTAGAWWSKRSTDQTEDFWCTDSFRIYRICEEFPQEAVCGWALAPPDMSWWDTPCPPAVFDWGYH